MVGRILPDLVALGPNDLTRSKKASQGDARQRRASEALREAPVELRQSEFMGPDQPTIILGQIV